MSRKKCAAVLLISTNILEGWDQIHLKGDIHRYISSTRSFLCNVREPRYNQNNMVSDFKKSIFCVEKLYKLQSNWPLFRTKIRINKKYFYTITIKLNLDYLLFLNGPTRDLYTQRFLTWEFSGRFRNRKCRNIAEYFLFLKSDIQYCFAYILASRYCTEDCLYSKQTYGFWFRMNHVPAF